MRFLKFFSKSHIFVFDTRPVLLLDFFCLFLLLHQVKSLLSISDEGLNFLQVRRLSFKQNARITKLKRCWLKTVTNSKLHWLQLSLIFSPGRV